MTAAATVLFVAAFLIFAWPLLFLAVLDLRDRLHDRSDAHRREQQGRETTPEWLAVLAAVEPEVPALPRRRPSDLSALPSVARIRDRIAANEAAHIDDEWKAMNR